MNQLTTTGIVLARTDYGEADRILTVITPDHGKLRLMAKGVRRVKSKLAGGIELFSVSDITFMRGRSDIGTLISARLTRHYGRIVADIERVQLGYELIRVLNKVTEDAAEPDYFDLLELTFSALDNTVIDSTLVRLWFQVQLLRLGGHSPNLQTDTRGNKLEFNRSYEFSVDAMAFTAANDGPLKASHIKFLRLLFSGVAPNVLQKVIGQDTLLPACTLIVRLLGDATLGL